MTTTTVCVRSDFVLPVPLLLLLLFLLVSAPHRNIRTSVWREISEINLRQSEKNAEHVYVSVCVACADGWLTSTEKCLKAFDRFLSRWNRAAAGRTNGRTDYLRLSAMPKWLTMNTINMSFTFHPHLSALICSPCGIPSQRRRRRTKNARPTKNSWERKKIESNRGNVVCASLRTERIRINMKNHRRVN